MNRQVKAMGMIEIEQDRDYWAELSQGIGSATTTNDSVTDESPKNPIGFIWPKQDSDPASELC